MRSLVPRLDARAASVLRGSSLQLRRAAVGAFATAESAAEHSSLLRDELRMREALRLAEARPFQRPVLHERAAQPAAPGAAGRLGVQAVHQ